MDTILVTGGAGFIGGCFVRQWLRDERDALINLDALTYAGNLDSLLDVEGHDRYQFVRGDVRDRALLAGVFERHRPRAVVHFAAESHVDRSIAGPRGFIESNIVGTFELLEASRRFWETLDGSHKSIFRFIQVSTDEVYGSLGATGRFDETSRFDPSSPYSASKASADLLATAYHRTYGLPTIVTHCSNNFGPYQFPEKLIPLTIANALQGRTLPVYGDGRQVRDWLYVDDHCCALRMLLQRGGVGHTYAIGANQERSNIEIVESLCDLIDALRPSRDGRSRRHLIRFVADRPGHDRRYALDAAKLRQIGWRPRIAFHDGLERTVRWYLENQPWVDRILAGTYRQHNAEPFRESFNDDQQVPMRT